MDPIPQDIDSYLRERIPRLMPAGAFAVLLRAAEMAAEHGWDLYLVGGYVRDSLLKIPDYDIDTSLVGDAPAIARRLAEETGAQLELHEAFRTAVLWSKDGSFDLDIVTARSEIYEHPGALPMVRPGTIADDMARRDFTANAMAVSILPSGIGHLYDPHGGLDDLRAGIIRVLHNSSFIDDPTRIFRAVKLAVRLGWHIEPLTLELILQAVRDGVFVTVSMDRIRHELLLIFEEPKAEDILAELDKLGVLRGIHPLLTWPYQAGRGIILDSESLSREQRRNTTLTIIAAEFAGAEDDAEELGRWLHLPAPMLRLLRDAARLVGLWPRLGEQEQQASTTYRLLQELTPDAIEAALRVEPLAQDTFAAGRLRDYLSRLRFVQPQLNGSYIRGLGVPPGPIYRRVLDALLDAVLDGVVKGREAEEAFMLSKLVAEGWAQK